MDLSIYSIKVGRTSIENLNVNRELGMDASIISRDNPSYENDTNADNATTQNQILDVFDVLLA